MKGFAYKRQIIELDELVFFFEGFKDVGKYLWYHEAAVHIYLKRKSENLSRRLDGGGEELEFGRFSGCFFSVNPNLSSCHDLYESL